jgi:hypothetical protein
MFLSLNFRDHPRVGLLCTPGEDVWVGGALEGAFQLLQLVGSEGRPRLLLLWPLLLLLLLGLL